MTPARPLLPVRLPVRCLPLLLLLAATSQVSNAAETIELFNGRDLEGWTTFKGEPITRGWVVDDGMLRLSREQGRGGHIVNTRRINGDFELHFQWKIARGGNSGLKYRVRRYGKKLLGCEFQLLDDPRHKNGRNPLTSAGALYGMFAPADGKKLAPLDEFNDSRVVVRRQRIQHWLNGLKIIDVEVGSDAWTTRIRRSKFSENPDFGSNRAGVIMLQDHGSDVWFRKLSLRLLDSDTATSAEAAQSRGASTDTPAKTR